MQIATRVQKNMKLKFVYNNTYFHDASVQNVLGGKQQMTLIGFNCNSPGDLHARGRLDGSANITGMWTSQKPSAAPGGNPDAEGLAHWQDRYEYFCVTKAKITIMIKTEYHAGGMVEPTLVFLHKSGQNDPENVLSTASGAEAVNLLPYVTKAHIMGSNLSTGVKLEQTYTAGRFEGVKGSVVGIEEYKGGMSPFTQPVADTNWIFGICNAKGSINQPTITAGGGNDNMTPKLLVQVKIEYEVSLTEPTTQNQPAPQPAGLPVN